MIKKILLIIAVVLTIAGIYMSKGMLWSIVQFLFAHPLIMSAVMMAVGIQLLGHILRAQRTKLIIDQASSSSLQFQFGALSIGYLFNTLLPLRLGEIIRALLVARRLHISFLYTFVAIVIERAIDIIFLGILIVIGGFIIGSAPAWGLIIAGVIGVAVSSAILGVLLLLKNENAVLLRCIAWLSQFFNHSIANSIRFKVWSLIFGLQNFFGNAALVRRYIVYALVSWACYLVSAAIIVVVLLDSPGILHLIITSISPYVIALNPLDASSYQQLGALLPLNASINNLDMYARITWAVLVLPMAAIGFIALVLYRPGTKQTARNVKADPYMNKLMRHQDISQDFPVFLDSYFEGNRLAKILHKIEVSGELSLVKYFKGGSDAITVLVLQHGQLFVKKIIPLEYEDRLKAQFTWLHDHAKLPYLVKVIGEHKTEDHYEIDLAYDPKNIPFFEYAHHSSYTESKAVIDKVWQALYDHLYKKVKEPVYNPKARDAYIEKHIFGCADKAAASHADIKVILKQPTIIINGKEYDNLHKIMDRIKNNKQAWRDIATFSEAPAVHGDPSIDNILVAPSTGKPLIIDPAPDGNIINGPVFDLGKFSQSFYCGYEFSFRDEEPVRLENKNSVRYRDHMSARYSKLWRYVHTELAPHYVSEAEQRAMLFHAGALHIRRLKHQVHYNADNTLKFYAVGVKALNEFLDQYK